VTQQDQDRVRIATARIYDVGQAIIGVSSPLYDAKASTRALVNQETMAALIDTFDSQGNAYKPDKYDAILAARLEALLAQLTALTAQVAPVESAPPPMVNEQGHNPGPPPPPPGQLPNAYVDEFALATPATSQQLPAPPEP
jgi:hypothetical protein